jgi:hypothetical protein
MATIEALQPRLRQLKLSGMVDSIAARVQEARARPLDPLDFLLLLLEDELMRRESESIDRYIHRAHFDEVCDLRDFDFTYNPEIPKARIWELASGRFVDERASILLCGPTGVGKPSSLRHSGSRSADNAAASCSPRPTPSWRIWLVVAPKATGKLGCAATSRPTWSFWTTSPCASTR